MFQLNGCIVHLERDEVQRPDERVPLTRTESRLLRYLMEHPNRILHRSELNEAVLGYHAKSRSRALNTLVQRLRRKIEIDPHRPDHLITVYGKGYCFQIDHFPTGNIRDRPTTFVGRERELRTLRAVLSETGRILLLGHAGLGKTRLAEEYALEARDRYPGGCWICDLSEAQTAADVSLAVARALDLALLAAESTDKLETRIGIAMRAMGPLLLVADASETVISLLDRPLSTWLRAGSVHIVVTSRVRLGLLQWPTLDLQGLPPSEACELFRHRSAVGAADRASIEPLVALLDGVPTAIEFAAARARTTSTQSTLEAMRDGSVSDVPVIQQALEWVWSQLSELERRSLARCTLFRTPFGVEDVAGVVLESPGATEAAIALLQTLQDHGLLQRTPRGEGRATYTLLRLVWRFAASHIDEGAAAAHAAWYGERLLALYEDCRTTTARAYLSLCRAHLEDLIDARQTALEQGSSETAHRLGLALIPFLYQSGPAALFREFIDTALERPMSPTDRAEILSWRSGHHISVGELHAARRYLTEAIREVGWRGKARIQGRIWHLMSRMAWNRKPNGRRLFAHTLEVMQEAGDAFGHALTASEFAQRTLSAALEAPNESAVAEALQCYEHAQLACAQMSSPYLDAHLSWCISYVDRLDGRLEDARQRLLDLRDTYIALSSPMNAWSVEFSLAYLAWWSRGDYARMSEHMLGAQRLAAGFGSTHLTLRTAAVLYEAGPSPHARKWLEQSLRDTLGADIADRVRIRAQARLALCNIELGETTEAIQTLERCLQRSMRTGHIPLEDEVSLGLGLALQVTGAWKRAGAVFAARRHDDSEEMMKQRLLCEVLTAAGDFATGGTAPTPCWRAVASRAHGLGEGRLLGVVQTFLRAVGEPLLHEPLPDVSPRGAILPHERRLGAMVAERVRALTEEDRLSLNPVVSHTRESVI